MIFSIQNLAIELFANGDPFTIDGGFSEDSDAVMFETTPIVADPRVGADGSVAYFRSPDKGGKFTLKLLPNSPAVPFLMEQWGIVWDGGQMTWNGSVRDTQRGIRVALRNGQLLSAQPFPSYGAGAASNYEFEFHFAEIEPDYSAAKAGAFTLEG